jgi:hypothetical protein
VPVDICRFNIVRTRPILISYSGNNCVHSNEMPILVVCKLITFGYYASFVLIVNVKCGVASMKGGKCSGERGMVWENGRITYETEVLQPVSSSKPVWTRLYVGIY